jgi:solute carrier family 41
MREVDQLIMIIPVVLNLKGNLEMNLSARLGTAANVGELDNPVVRRKMILGNLTLLQVQATVVSFVAACVAFLLGFVVPRTPAPEAMTPSQDGVETATRSIADVLVDLALRRPRPSLPPVDTSRKTGLHTCVECFPLSVFPDA